MPSRSAGCLHFYSLDDYIVCQDLYWYTCGLETEQALFKLEVVHICAASVQSCLPYGTKEDSHGKEKGYRK